MSESVQSIAADQVVGIHYTLKNASGEVIDSSSGDEPLYYLHGHDNIVPGLERKLSGRKVGDKLNVTVQPADGYGERDPRGEQRVPREAFPPGTPLEEGVQLALRDPSGQIVPIWISKVESDVVHVDLNHPLAGEVLHFDVEVVSLRKATDEELEHGHPHGADGHEGHHH
ncbi:FKBP-type peptidyl-prolyl cis-trans isomerase [Sandaracinus amylolyticus]|uniref:Peptidyl-prolyl cis-trans isomerase n=1 Tax=Sandaracinus amylolyticus TaxID=927083 RepID=A0A0F6SHA0_9BACT|nr:peptidylprolyl isomerase [Sandaracinus amylolyticus]AKF10079.1 FKBP-type peptidyl-prolyl cis-trans isomerase SlyD [Sandaracinus amylolyticus]